ncbi:MAG: helix-turn-helix domain-containing protein [Proteobacteria bacterium]|jgi:hypothetical protein|nr:helix-turn-helix domain-containing protein [Pseudomonadota bacterium]
MNTEVKTDIGLRNGNLIRASELAKHLNMSLETLYDWKYRARERRIPEGMFLKIGKMLYVRLDIFETWISRPPGEAAHNCRLA